MKYHQGDIVEVNFLFPNGTFKPHPALIVSNDELQETEDIIYLCLISSKDYNDQYCFPITEEMVTVPFEKQSFVKCQIIVGNIERDVLRKHGSMKPEYLDKVIDKIITSIF